mmetsp:Transcript_125964/g.245638  ORF Transcript_125964/g.245638 Transcript_125964/m.245638 type:complete len:179 (+) Transcript_125964:37-573(+)
MVCIWHCHRHSSEYAVMQQACADSQLHATYQSPTLNAGSLSIPFTTTTKGLEPSVSLYISRARPLSRLSGKHCMEKTISSRRDHSSRDNKLSRHDCQLQHDAAFFPERAAAEKHNKENATQGPHISRFPMDARRMVIKTLRRSEQVCAFRIKDETVGLRASSGSVEISNLCSQRKAVE